MNSLQSIQQQIKPELDKLNERIRHQLGSANPLMETVIETYLKKKGKQIRPIIVILSAKMMGECNENSLAAAAAVELLHNASLIHDDVVDNSMLRRGQATINSIWDNHVAVLVGDFFVSSAMQQAISTANINVIDSLCYLGKQLSLGELDQIYNAKHHSLTEEAYFRIIDYKTASLFVACAKMGCYTVGVEGDKLDKLAEFARLMGLCFQIRDDIFDYSTDQTIGKPTGNDLREGKITLPLLYALCNSESHDVDDMRKLAYNGMPDDNSITTLYKFAADNGGIDYAFNRMRLLRDQAFEILKTLPSNQGSEALKSIFDYIISR